MGGIGREEHVQVEVVVKATEEEDWASEDG